MIRPLWFYRFESLVERRQLPAYARIESISAATGQPSPYGCGWNVLFMLDIVDREYAQAQTDMIVAAHYAVGAIAGDGAAQAAHGGLHMTTMVELIQPFSDTPLHYIQWTIAPTDRTPELFRAAIQQLCFPKDEITQPFAYVIIKLLYNIENNIGHTILLQFSRRADGLYDCHSFDVQMNRVNTFEEFIVYLLQHPIFVGISIIARPTVGGKNKNKTKNMKNKRNKTKKMKGGGFNFKMIKPLDPELNPMSDEDYEIYMSGMNTILKDEPSKLSTQTTAFNFSKKHFV
jgi:hypothetical protein